MAGRKRSSRSRRHHAKLHPDREAQQRMFVSGGGCQSSVKGKDMGRFGKGLLGGIVATAVMSALMLMKSAMGLMPQLDVIPGGSALVRGMLFGAGAWLVMMVMVMPMAGAGFFGMKWA